MSTNNINVINYIDSVELEKYLNGVLTKILVNDASLKNIIIFCTFVNNTLKNINLQTNI